MVDIILGQNNPFSQKSVFKKGSYEEANITIKLGQSRREGINGRIYNPDKLPWQTVKQHDDIQARDIIQALNGIVRRKASGNISVTLPEAVVRKYGDRINLLLKDTGMQTKKSGDTHLLFDRTARQKLKENLEKAGLLLKAEAEYRKPLIPNETLQGKKGFSLLSAVWNRTVHSLELFGTFGLGHVLGGGFFNRNVSDFFKPKFQQQNGNLFLSPDEAEQEVCTTIEITKLNNHQIDNEKNSIVERARKQADNIRVLKEHTAVLNETNRTLISKLRALQITQTEALITHKNSPEYQKARQAVNKAKADIKKLEKIIQPIQQNVGEANRLIDLYCPHKKASLVDNLGKIATTSGSQDADIRRKNSALRKIERNLQQTTDEDFRTTFQLNVNLLKSYERNCQDLQKARTELGDKAAGGKPATGLYLALETAQSARATQEHIRLETILGNTNALLQKAEENQKQYMKLQSGLLNAQRRSEMALHTVLEIKPVDLDMKKQTLADVKHHSPINSAFRKESYKALKKAQEISGVKLKSLQEKSRTLQTIQADLNIYETMIRNTETPNKTDEDENTNETGQSTGFVPGFVGTQATPLSYTHGVQADFPSYTSGSSIPRPLYTDTRGARAHAQAVRSIRAEEIREQEKLLIAGYAEGAGRNQTRLLTMMNGFQEVLQEIYRLHPLLSTNLVMSGGRSSAMGSVGGALTKAVLEAAIPLVGGTIGDRVEQTIKDYDRNIEAQKFGNFENFGLTSDDANKNLASMMNRSTAEENAKVIFHEIACCLGLHLADKMKKDPAYTFNGDNKAKQYARRALEGILNAGDMDRFKSVGDLTLFVLEHALTPHTPLREQDRQPAERALKLYKKYLEKGKTPVMQQSRNDAGHYVGARTGAIREIRTQHSEKLQAGRSVSPIPSPHYRT